VISRNSINGAFPIKRLGEVVEFLDSKRRPVTESDRRAGPYPYYGANGIQGTIDKFIFDEPLVLLAEDGGHFGEPDRGIAYRISGKTWVNNHAHVLRPKSCVDLAYLCRVLENYDVTPFVTGTTRGKLTKAGASEIVIPVPPVAEQRRVAEVLDRAEALRAKRRGAHAQLDSLTQSLFLDLFGDPATNPNDWRIKTLDELCQGITDIDHKMPAAVKEGVPFISAKDLTDDGRISFENVKRISEEDFRRLSRKSKPQKGDIVYSRIGVNLGKARMVDVDFDFLASYSCCTIKPNRELVDATYLCNLLDSPFILRQAHKSVRAIAVPDLGMGEIKAFTIIVPPIKLQREFARRIQAVEKLKTTQRESLAELDALFATLQHRAFRGEL
jgi:type I restriction enzyme S subunit